MPTPPKPAKVIKMEGRSHRTKSELAERERAEEQLLTGRVLRESKEVKENPAAHKEFQRIKKLLKSIGKDDNLYGAAINRYCMLQAECTDLMKKRKLIEEQMERMEESYQVFEKKDDIKSYYALCTNMQKNLVSVDRQIQAKRKMMLDIEKENVMTIAASLRSIPKKPEKKKNLLMEALTGES